MNISKIQQNIYVPSFFGDNNKSDKKSPYVLEKNCEFPYVRNLAMEHEFALRTEDNCYRANLLKSIGLSKYSQYKISPIMGPNETRRVLKELDASEENFKATKENIESGKFRANLHIHTIASDGYYSPKQLLNDAAEYADKVHEKTGKKFVIAITDHDTIDSYPQIIKEVHDNSDKYKNLKIILGMESTTYDDVKNKPIQLHMLAYNIDPSDKKFTDFLKNQKEKKYELSKHIIENINKQYNSDFEKGDLFTFEEYTNMYPTMKKGLISPHNYIRNYAMTKLLLNEVVPNMKILDDYFTETNPSKNADIEMKKMKDIQYIETHNNKSYTALNGLTQYYSQATNIDPEVFAENLFETAMENDKVINFIEKVNPKLYSHRDINGKNLYVNVNEVCEALSNQPKVILGIAHPLNCVIDGKKFDAGANVLYPSQKTSSPKESQSEQFITDLYETFKKNAKDRAKFSERYYQSYSSKKTDIQTPLEMQECIDKLSKKYDLLRTGGYDSHRETLFSRY